jgi:hypothetical protein
MRAGLGPCVAPRNHDGPCQYPTDDGGRAVLMKMAGNPVEMAQEIESLYLRTRKAYRIAKWATIVTVAAAAWNITDVVARVLGS